MFSTIRHGFCSGVLEVRFEEVPIPRQTVNESEVYMCRFLPKTQFAGQDADHD